MPKLKRDTKQKKQVKKTIQQQINEAFDKTKPFTLKKMAKLQRNMEKSKSYETIVCKTCNNDLCPDWEYCPYCGEETPEELTYET